MEEVKYLPVLQYGFEYLFKPFQAMIISRVMKLIWGLMLRPYLLTTISLCGPENMDYYFSVFSVSNDL